ncbi:unnamed protein product [Calicophoron daubneyi]|uniref:oxaloacetate tautomerase n=1 Tax=Calicophoron daubneyi TaxID=300641 RepID=A0AAV2TH00_CALDB
MMNTQEMLENAADNIPRRQFMTTNLRQICRKVVAVGRNYIAHAIELGSVIQDEPVVFLKPPSSIIEQGEKIRLPKDASEVHHEVELGLVIGKELSNVGTTDLASSILGFVVALDMTDRELQNKLKSRQLPWTLAKCFDTSCPVGPVLPVSLLPPHLFTYELGQKPSTDQPLELWLSVNGSPRQRGSIDSMIYNPAQLISFISHHMRLEPGDLILTGTPAGVGAVRSGDVIKAGIGKISEIEFSVS